MLTAPAWTFSSPEVLMMQDEAIGRRARPRRRGCRAATPRTRLAGHRFLQYVIYDRFNGAGRNYDFERRAWDNNTLYVSAWLGFGGEALR